MAQTPVGGPGGRAGLCGWAEGESAGQMRARSRKARIIRVAPVGPDARRLGRRAVGRPGVGNEQGTTRPSCISARAAVASLRGPRAGLLGARARPPFPAHAKPTGPCADAAAGGCPAASGVLDNIPRTSRPATHTTSRAVGALASIKRDRKGRPAGGGSAVSAPPAARPLGPSRPRIPPAQRPPQSALRRRLPGRAQPRPAPAYAA